MKLFTEEDFLWKTNLEIQSMLAKLKRTLSWHFLSYLSHLAATQTALKLFVVEHKWNWKAHVVEHSQLVVDLLAC